MTAAVMAALGVPVPSSAALITRSFEFSSTDGPLTFGPRTGSLTYDDSVAPAGGGFVWNTGLLTDLSVSFGGFSFDETTANTGGLYFDASGELLGARFGNNCVASGSCSVVWGEQDWWMQVSVPGAPNDFAYSGFNGATQFYQSFNNRLLPLESVPEPASIALLGMGLVGMLMTRRKGASSQD